MYLGESIGQRACIYEMGETYMADAGYGCPDPLYDGNPLVDWSEVVNVTDSEPLNPLWILAGLALVAAFMKGR